MSAELSFADIDGLDNVGAVNPDSEMPLPKWYNSIRNIPISEFTAGDLAKAIRQNCFLENVMPWAIIKLKEDILAGELYDGELFSSVCACPEAFWKKYKAYHKEIVGVLNQTGSEIIEAELGEEGLGCFNKLINLK